MKKMKRFFAMVLALAMVLGMSATAFAGQIKTGTASEGDTADVKIEGITGNNATITLYQIAAGEYGESGEGLIGYKYVEGITPLSKEPTSTEINNAHLQIIAKGIESIVITTDDIDSNMENKKLMVITPKESSYTYTIKDLEVGAYIAIITGADDSVYNPVLLSVSYNENGAIVPGDVNVTEGYTYGSTAVAKQTTPKIDKELIAGTTPDGDKKTAGIGDVVTYQITPTMPSYPANAKNKTFFYSDIMSEGLTFLFETLTIEITGQEIKAEQNGDIIKYALKVSGDEAITEEDIVIATATKAVEKNEEGTAEVKNGFYLSFNYDALVKNQTTEEVYVPIVKYQAVLNEKAVVGGEGNPNDAKMYYANKPNEGNTFDFEPENPEKPNSKTEGVKETEDSEKVYTYQLAFLKKGEGDDIDKLEGAVFGVYDKDDKLIDVVTTNDKGIAVSTKVKAGTYTIKELVAPTGYALNDKTYKLEATWKTSTSTVTVSKTKWKYTTNKDDSSDKVQVGWIKPVEGEDGIFYAMDEYTEETAVEAGVLAAYTVYNQTTYESSTITESNEGAGTAASLIEVGKADNSGKVDYIPNTKMTSLPSTGGIGTTIFTIGGCLIMVIAAALFFVSRRKTAK